MRLRPALFLVLCIALAAFFLTAILPPAIHAQSLATGSGTAKWVESPVITELGKSSERSRQLLFWVMSHPPVYNAPVLAQVWAVSRNIAYAMVVLTMIMFAVGFFLAQRRGMTFGQFSASNNFGSILLKLVIIMLYITFSYILILLLIQFSEILMRFFIENVGGKDLFNIVFSSQNQEKNYIDFKGFWDTNVNNWEMRNTSIFMIKLTNITYNVMAIMLIVRHVILWFLLIVSPFLALLMPFIFIRNTGWIWIGVFFQWIFYGPLFALFLASLAKIWKAGIPYSFQFQRAADMVAGKEQPVYPTSINILWGGPAQTLSFFNSANYVDTYAEYVISLIMLWVATFLPWLLLRIFRDYCCDILAQNQATLVQILDKMRGIGNPPPPPAKPTPVSISGSAIDLPFRQAFETPQRAMLAKLEDIQKAQTSDIARALNMSVSSIQDIAEYDMNRIHQAQTQDNLDNLRNPNNITDDHTRERFTNMKNELMSRASHGDVLAKRLMSSIENKPREMFRSSPTGLMGMTTPDVASKVGVSEKTVNQVLQSVPVMGTPSVQTIQQVSQKVGIAPRQVQQILATARPPVGGRGAKPGVVPGVSIPQVSVDDYEEVKSMWVSHYREADVPVSETIKERQQWIEEDIKKLSNVLNLLSSIDPELKQKGVDEVGAILPFLMLGGFSDIETIMYLKAKLAAAKQVDEELSGKKEETKETEESEDELLSINKAKPFVDKSMQASQTMQRELSINEEPAQREDDEVSSAVRVKENVQLDPALITQQSSLELARTLHVAILSLKDIARTDADLTQKDQIKKTLGLLHDPASIMDEKERETYLTARNEIIKRAAAGDRVAQRVMLATEGHILETFRPSVPKPGLYTTPEIVTKTGVTEEKIKAILAAVPPSSQTDEQHILQVAQQTQVQPEQLKQILVMARPQVAEGQQSSESPQVTVDDYEEVKTMWEHHYQEMNVPGSENGKTRPGWISEEITETENIINLLNSPDQNLRNQGLEKVQNILPLLALGGFTESETMVYLKAKLAAAKQILKQLQTGISNALFPAKEDDLVNIEKKEKNTDQSVLEQALGEDIPTDTPPADTVSPDTKDKPQS